MANLLGVMRCGDYDDVWRFVVTVAVDLLLLPTFLFARLQRCLAQVT
jgi:hypothetical protein